MASGPEPDVAADKAAIQAMHRQLAEDQVRREHDGSDPVGAFLRGEKPVAGNIDFVFLRKYARDPYQLAGDVEDVAQLLIHCNKQSHRIFAGNFRDFADGSSWLTQVQALGGFMKAHGFSLDDYARWVMSRNKKRSWLAQTDEEMAFALRSAWNFTAEDLNWFRREGDELPDEVCNAIYSKTEPDDPSDPPGSAPLPKPLNYVEIVTTSSAVAAGPSFKSASSFTGQYTPLAYVVEPFLRTSTTCTITGATGAGKTALLVLIAIAVATGRRDVLGCDVETGRVAYFAFENPDDVRMRIIAGADMLGVDLESIGDKIVILDARVSPEAMVSMLRAAATEEAFSLTIVDTLAAAFDGTDSNSAVQAGEFIRRLRPITQMPGLPAVLIAAHPIKSARDEALVPYGSGAILNEVDGNLSLAKQGDRTVLHWAGKFRGLAFPPIHFCFHIHSAPGLLDNKGRRVPIPVLRPADSEVPATSYHAAQAPAAVAPAAGADRDTALLRAIARSAPGATVRDLAVFASITKSSVDRGLKSLKADKLIETTLRGQLKITDLGLRNLERGA